MEPRFPGSGIFGVLFLKREVGRIFFERCSRCDNNFGGDAIEVEFFSGAGSIF